ncbi:hypothetical protein RF55_25496, partial [Lasius niger]
LVGISRPVQSQVQVYAARYTKYSIRGNSKVPEVDDFTMAFQIMPTNQDVGPVRFEVASVPYDWYLQGRPHEQVGDLPVLTARPSVVELTL